MHIDEFVRGKGRFVHHRIRADRGEGQQSQYPLLLTTGRILSPVQRRRADAAYRQRRLA